MFRRKVLILCFFMEKLESSWVMLTQINSKTTWPHNGCFVAAAAFTADVKVGNCVLKRWFSEGSVESYAVSSRGTRVQSAVTWLCFTPNSDQIISASNPRMVLLECEGISMVC